VKAVEPISLEFAASGKRKVTFGMSVPIRRCAACGEVLYALRDLQAFDLRVANELGKRGMVNGETFRFMRKTVGLTGVALAQLLDLSAEEISRWENGHRTITRSAFSTLWSIVSDRLEGRETTLEHLRALREPKPLVKRVELEPAPGEGG
jgi:DNA-binding transcriptional regulator YiaG